MGGEDVFFPGSIVCMTNPKERAEKCAIHQNYFGKSQNQGPPSLNTISFTRYWWSHQIPGAPMLVIKYVHTTRSSPFVETWKSGSQWHESIGIPQTIPAQLYTYPLRHDCSPLNPANNKYRCVGKYLCLQGLSPRVKNNGRHKPIL